LASYVVSATVNGEQTMTKCEISVVTPLLDAKPWGGRKLEQIGLTLPEGEKIGEARLTADGAVVSAGIGQGFTLGEMVATNAEGRLGSLGMAAVRGASTFPLLVKLIDASENLSIQVHPDDDGAAALNKLGKTEAWHVLSAEADGALYLGLQEHIDTALFMEHARLLDGTSAADLRRLDARQGQTWMIPAGTVHALGAGVMVYEIQQPSDVTFRLDDWGRVDAEGNPREMHLTEGEAAMRAELRPREIPGVRRDTANLREILTACCYFALEKLSLPEMQEVELGNSATPNAVTVLSGQLIVGEHQLVAGETAVMWPGHEPVLCTAVARTVALRAWVPDLVRDIAIPVREAGGLDSDIAALGGMTGDLERLLA
jgi:mannose-6-phosphate isomerase